MTIQIQNPLAELFNGEEMEVPADCYYYLALSAGVIGIFASFLPFMPIFTILFTYKAYIEGGRYKAGIILSILNVLAALFMISVGVLKRELFGL